MLFAKLLRSFSLKFPLSGKCLSSFAVLPLIFAFSATLAHSVEVGLEWDPNPEPELAGYKLYYGLESRNYTSSVDVGNQTTYTLSDLQDDTVYYFAVTAYSTCGGESGYSEEISYLVPPPDSGGGDTGVIDSDGDGISDRDEIDLYGTDPYDPDSDGDGVTDGAEIGAGSDPRDPDSKPESVKIWLEAEDGFLNLPMAVFQDSEASSGEYIEAPNGSGYPSAPSKDYGYAEYAFEVPDAGDYVIWGRISAIDGGDDSFFVSVDNGDSALWDTQRSENWVWDQVGHRDGSDPVIHRLEAGQHLLTVYQREDGTKIDRILITNEMGYVPEGAGGESRSSVYEDAEDSATSGWNIYDKTPDGATIANVYDDERQSRVIRLTGTGTSNGFRLRNNDGNPWGNSSQFVIEWSMNYSEPFKVYIDVETTAGHRYLQYEPVDVNNLGEGGYVHHGLGSGAADGQWHRFVRDLQADLEEAQPGVTILEVNAFLIRGSGKVDDVKLLDALPVDPATIYEDAEDGATSGWNIYDKTPDGATIANVYDEECQSRVIQLTGTSTRNGFRLRNNDGSPWANSSQFVIEWSMNYSESFKVYVDVETTAGHRYLQYEPVDFDNLGEEGYVHHGLGSGADDGQWRRFVRDLQVDLEEAQPGVTILEVNAFLIRGSGRIDSIKLHDERPLIN